MEFRNLVEDGRAVLALLEAGTSPVSFHASSTSILEDIATDTTHMKAHDSGNSDDSEQSQFDEDSDEEFNELEQVDSSRSRGNEEIEELIGGENNSDTHGVDRIIVPTVGIGGGSFAAIEASSLNSKQNLSGYNVEIHLLVISHHCIFSLLKSIFSWLTIQPSTASKSQLD